MHRGDHLRVEGRHDLGGGLDQRDLHPLVDQVLGHLDTDEAATDHHRAPALGALVVEAAGLGQRSLHRLDQGVGVLDIAQRERALDAGDRGADGSGAGGEHQRRVGDLLRNPRGEIAQRDGLRLCVDRGRLGVYAHIQAEARAEAGRCLQQECRALLDDPAHVIRQAAVGEAHMPATLDDNDPCGLIQAAKSGGRGHAAGDAADDDNGA